MPTIFYLVSQCPIKVLKRCFVIEDSKSLDAVGARTVIAGSTDNGVTFQELQRRHEKSDDSAFRDQRFEEVQNESEQKKT